MFQLLANRVWSDLRDADKAGLRLGEESITDHTLLSLVRACPREILVHKFTKIQEGRTTGADWEWWFTERHFFYGIRIQAKVLDGKTLRYESLDHRVRKNRKLLQADMLLRDARKQRPPRYPMYCFYNYRRQGIADLPWNCGTFASSNGLFGCTVADGARIAAMAKNGAKDINSIAKFSFPWSCLVCCRGFSARGQTLAHRVEAFARGLARAGGSPDGKRVPEVIHGADNLPGYVLRLLRGATESSDFTTSEGGRLDGVMLVRGDGD